MDVALNEELRRDLEDCGVDKKWGDSEIVVIVAKRDWKCTGDGAEVLEGLME